MTSSERQIVLPSHLDLYYGGKWHPPMSGRQVETFNPATGKVLARVGFGDAGDANAAVAAAKSAFPGWRDTPPLQRARALRAAGEVIRKHGRELALIDAADCGNPVKEMSLDANVAASSFEFFAGLVTEMKGASIPMGPDAVNFSVREPMGVVARIVAFNHPFMFVASKAAAPLAAGNTVIMKPPEQAPLSALRLAELLDGILPPGVLNILPGGRDLGGALTSHKDVAMVTLIGSVPTGRAVMKSASDTVKPVLLELGGKNALIALPDADPRDVARAMADGMNFTWCGQSCGSVSRAFLHEDIHDAVLKELPASLARYVPGDPTDDATTMGALISKKHHAKVMSYIAFGKEDGARLVCGGGRPKADHLSGGNFVEPTVFADVTQNMRIASEEIFGPVLSVLKWRDEQAMLADVNGVEYGLTSSIWSNNLTAAHRIAAAVQAGFVWINEVSKHFAGAPFGGVKQSGIGREECLGELLAFTQEKNIYINLKGRNLVSSM